MTFQADSADLAWAVGSWAVARANDTGATRVVVGDREWRRGMQDSALEWQTVDAAPGADDARSPSTSPEACDRPAPANRRTGPPRRAYGRGVSHEHVDVAGAALARGSGPARQGNGAVVERLEPSGRSRARG